MIVSACTNVASRVGGKFTFMEGNKVFKNNRQETSVSLPMVAPMNCHYGVFFLRNVTMELHFKKI